MLLQLRRLTQRKDLKSKKKFRSKEMCDLDVVRHSQTRIWGREPRMPENGVNKKSSTSHSSTC